MDKDNAKNIDNRLATIEGHIRGVRQMVADGKDCSDVLLQLSAIESSVQKLSKAILKNHIEHCVKDSVTNGDLTALDRLNEVLDKYK
ncbi:MAG TPA: metal-sensitive transcriptional regulator [Clostridia bacterium]|nr:metal-sensitive transcriptional regulator [Clostridia bacterium]